MLKYNLVPENVSPNVTLHLPDILAQSVVSGPIVCQISNGVVQIDTDLDFYGIVNEAFSIHQKAGHVYPVSFNGLKDINDEKIGSHRACMHSKHLANHLTEVVRKADILDLNQHGQEFLNVSQYFRVMKYTEGGEHAPHYDSDYQFPNRKYLTKYSLVMYLTNCASGEIFFCHDKRQDHDQTDWNLQATDDEIYLKILPKKGRIVIFDHSLCHGVLPFTDKNKERLIIRGDLIYKRTYD